VCEKFAAPTITIGESYSIGMLTSVAGSVLTATGMGADGIAAECRVIIPSITTDFIIPMVGMGLTITVDTMAVIMVDTAAGTEDITDNVYV
jgi:hypothetical protein